MFLSSEFVSFSFASRYSFLLNIFSIWKILAWFDFDLSKLWLLFIKYFALNVWKGFDEFSIIVFEFWKNKGFFWLNSDIFFVVKIPPLLWEVFWRLKGEETPIRGFMSFTSFFISKWVCFFWFWGLVSIELIFSLLKIIFLFSSPHFLRFCSILLFFWLIFPIFSSNKWETWTKLLFLNSSRLMNFSNWNPEGIKNNLSLLFLKKPQLKKFR